jgi:hypothetical protein
MFANRTVVAVLAAVIALLGCDPGHSNAPAANTAGGFRVPANGVKWTLGGVPCCTLIAVPAAAPPVGTGTCPGVRPGAIVLSEVGQCTLNFLFQGSDGRRYIGTAGHCILGASPIGGDVGEKSWAPGTGPLARDSGGNRIGEFAYAILQDPKDFSLIRLDPQAQASAGMCHFGGPTGVNDDRPALSPTQPVVLEPVVLEWFGNGIVAGSTVPARTGIAAGMPSPDHVFAQGAATPGDSGSGVISSDGRAVGALVTVGAHTGRLGLAGGDAGLVGITRLTPQVERAQQVLGANLVLQSAPTQ